MVQLNHIQSYFFVCFFVTFNYMPDKIRIQAFPFSALVPSISNRGIQCIYINLNILSQDILVISDKTLGSQQINKSYQT